MTITLTANDIDLEMQRYKEPLDQLRESVHEWGLGTWTLSKNDKRWRIGFGHELRETAKWIAYPLTWYGLPYIGLVFDSGGDHPAWYMAGWLHPYQAEVADYWVAFLNAEIADRLAGKASKYDGRIGLDEDFQNEITASEIEAEGRRQESFRGFVPSPKLIALREAVDKELAEERLRRERAAEDARPTPHADADDEERSK